MYKYLAFAGQSWTGLNLKNDKKAIDYLLTRDDVDPDRIGCVGLSLGGFRSLMLAGMDERIDYRRSFRDAHKTFTEEQVKAETARCLGCGASVVDPNKCIGCGLCTTKCEFDAIHLNRELPECSRMVRSEDKFKAILPYMIKREMKIRFGKKDG